MKDYEARNRARYLLWYAADGFISSYTRPALVRLWSYGLRDLWFEFPWAVSVLPKSWRGDLVPSEGQWDQVKIIYEGGPFPDWTWTDATREWWEWIEDDCAPLRPEEPSEDDSGFDGDEFLRRYLQEMTDQAGVWNWCAVFPQKLIDLCAEYGVPVPTVHLTEERRAMAAEVRHCTPQSGWVSDETLTHQVTEVTPLVGVTDE